MSQRTISVKKRRQDACTTTAAIIIFAAVSVGLGQQTTPTTTSQPAESFVRPVDWRRLKERHDALSPRSRELVRLYMDAARRDVLTEADGCVPRDGSMHYRNLAERAKGAAVLAAFEGYWPEELRQRCRREASEWVAELAAAHVRQPSFGDPWQGALFSAEAAMAAWFLWDDLDAATRRAIAEMIVYQADRLANTTPKMGYIGNTEAETVSWNSAALTVALNMMPNHPRAAVWDRAAKIYLYNTFAVPQDTRDDSVGDDDRPVRDWILGINLHEDFALENHGQFHIEYLLACYRFHLSGAATYGVGGRPLPKAIHHHALDVYEKVMLHCMNHDGFFEYVPDNDWHRYHAWTESATLHAYIAFLERHALAASLETRALKNATRYWREMPAGWSYDNPYVCGKAWTPRIAEAVLLHVTAPGEPPPPLPDREADEKLAGTLELPSVKLLTHMSAGGSLRSYYAGPGKSAVRFVAPPTNSWMLLPTGIGYGALVDGKPMLVAGEVNWKRGPDWFWALRAAGNVGEAFISLPDEMVVYAELLPPTASASGTVEHAITIERPHRAFAIYYDGGAARYIIGQANWTGGAGPGSGPIRSHWANLDDAVGYVVVTSADGAAAELTLPDPTKRDTMRWRTAAATGATRGHCILVLPAQKHAQTADIARRARLFTIGNASAITAGDWTAFVNIGKDSVELRPPWKSDTPVELPPRSVCAIKAGTRVF